MSISIVIFPTYKIKTKRKGGGGGEGAGLVPNSWDSKAVSVFLQKEQGDDAAWRKLPLELEIFIISTHSDIYGYILSYHSGLDAARDVYVLVAVFPFCKIFFFPGKSMPASVSALQWEFNSFVGFENVSKGKNRQIRAVTQIQKLWEIQRWVDLRFCPRSIPKSQQFTHQYHGFSLESLLLHHPECACKAWCSHKGCAVSSNIFHARSSGLAVGYLLAEADMR